MTCHRTQQAPAYERDIGRVVYAGPVSTILGDTIDLTDAVSAQILVERPSGTDTWTATITPADGSDGFVTYTTQDGDLPEVGPYMLQALVVMPDGRELHGPKVQLLVEDAIEDASGPGPIPYPSTRALLVLEEPLHLYVAPTGDDVANDGRSPEAPFATYKRAVEELNQWDVLAFHEDSPGAAIHLASGTYDLAEIAVSRGEVLVHGDGAGQPGDDGKTEVLGPTAITTDSGGYELTVDGAGWTKNEFAGLFVEILDGPVAGAHRQIIRNDGVSLVLDMTVDGTVTGNRFRVFRPTVVIKEPSAWYPAVPKRLSIMRRTNDPFGLIEVGIGTSKVLASSDGSRCVVANVEFMHEPPDNSPPDSAVFGDNAYFNFRAVDVGGAVLYGVRFRVFVDEDPALPVLNALANAVPSWGTCLAGWDSKGETFSSDRSGRVRRWGLTSAENQWAGWGASVVNRTFSPTPFAGSLSVRRDDGESNNVVGVEWYLSGSSFISNGFWALHLIQSTLEPHIMGSEVSYVYSDNDDPDLQGSCIAVSAGSNVFLARWRLEKENLGNGLFVGQFGGGQGSQPSLVSIHSGVEIIGVTGTSQPDAAIRILVGGNVSSRIIPVSGFRRTLIVHKTDQARELEIVQEYSGDLAPIPPRHSVFPTPEQHCDFVAPGALSDYSDASPGSLALAATFGGVRRMKFYGLLDQLVLTQLVDGTAGSTTVELYRRRGASIARVETVTLAAGGGDIARAVVDLTDNALRALRPDDQLFVQFTERQTDGADVTVDIKSGGPSAFGTFRSL